MSAYNLRAKQVQKPQDRRSNGVCDLIEEAAMKQCGIGVKCSLFEGKLSIEASDLASYYLARSLAIKEFYFNNVNILPFQPLATRPNEP